MNRNKKRRLVEIYFILYLSALLFLLPDGKKDNVDGIGTGIQIYQPSFNLIPEKNTLICRVVLDSAGPRIMYLDSVNTIFYTGDVEDVNFEFTVEDQTINSSFTLSSNENTQNKFFSFTQNDDRHAAQFRWSPPLQEISSKTYVVKISAIAKKKSIVNSSEDEDVTSKTVKNTAQFSLLLIYLNEPGGNPLFTQTYYTSVLEDTSYQFTMPFQNLVPSIPTGKINMFSASSDIRQIAGQRWVNTVIVSNMNLKNDITSRGIEIEYSPKNIGGKAEIYDIRDDEIIIQGITPSYGKMKVKVSATRKYDGSEKYVTFNVSPEAFEIPDYERYMYPEITYEIDPKLPEIGQDVTAVIKNGNSIRAKSQKGEKFKFTPSNIDIDEVFYLERYIDKELLGEKYPIRVLQYPQPEIVDIQRISDREIEVITRSYGLKNKTRNEVESFEVDGNAVYRDLRGKITENREKSFPVTIQYFLFSPEDPDKPFSFKITAKDRIGSKSLPKIYR